MRIWVDADACPWEIRQVVFRAAQRTGVPACLVANQLLPTPPSDLISAVLVKHGADVADEHIVAEASPDDIVVTADIPLAAEIVNRGAVALSPRGQVFDHRNVHERLATRNLLDHLRGSGLVSGGPPSFKPADKQKFSNARDRLLTKRLRRRDGRGGAPAADG